MITVLIPTQLMAQRNKRETAGNNYAGCSKTAFRGFIVNTDN